MAEYIDRDAAIEAAKHAWAKGLEPSQYMEIIPAVDVAQARHSRWLYHTLIDGHIHAECSECHKVRIIDNYCPNCGAKMDGGADDGC